MALLTCYHLERTDSLHVMQIRYACHGQLRQVTCVARGATPLTASLTENATMLVLDALSPRGPSHQHQVRSRICTCLSQIVSHSKSQVCTQAFAEPGLPTQERTQSLVSELTDGWSLKLSATKLAAKGAAPAWSYMSAVQRHVPFKVYMCFCGLRG